MELNPLIPLQAGQIENPLFSLGRGIQQGQQMAATKQAMDLRDQQANQLNMEQRRQALGAGVQALKEIEIAGPDGQIDETATIAARRQALPMVTGSLQRNFGFQFPQDELAQFDVSNQGLNSFGASIGLKQPKITIDQQLRAREIQTKEDRLSFDRQQAKFKLEQMDSAIDQIDADEDTKKALKALPAESKGKAIEKFLDPSKLEKMRDVEAKNAQIKQEISSFAKTLDDPNFRSAVGVLDNLTSKVGQLWGSKDSQLNNQINRQSKSFVIKMAKSLGANPTDRDMKILLESIPSTWSQPEEWYNWFNDEAVPVFNARAEAQGLEPINAIVGESREQPEDADGRQQIGNYRVRVRGQ